MTSRHPSRFHCPRSTFLLNPTPPRPWSICYRRGYRHEHTERARTPREGSRTRPRRARASTFSLTGRCAIARTWASPPPTPTGASTRFPSLPSLFIVRSSPPLPFLPMRSKPPRNFCNASRLRFGVKEKMGGRRGCLDLTESCFSLVRGLRIIKGSQMYYERRACVLNECTGTPQRHARTHTCAHCITARRTSITVWTRRTSSPSSPRHP